MDATNPFVGTAPDLVLADLGGESASEIVARHAPDALVVKAFNSIRMTTYRAGPTCGDARRVIFVSGDHPDAKIGIGKLIVSFGFAVIDLGDAEEWRPHAAGWRPFGGSGPPSSPYYLIRGAADSVTPHCANMNQNWPNRPSSRSFHEDFDGQSCPSLPAAPVASVRRLPWLSPGKALMSRSATSWPRSEPRGSCAASKLWVFAVHCSKPIRVTPVAASTIVDRVVERFGRIDILVSNASIDAHGSVTDPERHQPTFDHFWSVALAGYMATVRATAKVISEDGRIVMIGSNLGTRTGAAGVRRPRRGQRRHRRLRPRRGPRCRFPQGHRQRGAFRHHGYRNSPRRG